MINAAGTSAKTQSHFGQTSPHALTRFMQGVIGEDIREGVRVKLSSRTGAGLTVRVVEENVEIDLTDQAITDLLAKHLLPRYRAIMR